MYLAILALPMFGSAVAGLRGRSIGVTGAHIITTGCLMASAALAIVAFYEVGLSGSPVSIVLGTWIDSEFMLVQWGFLFDSLTVSMLLPVLVVSSLVHLYSISYMAEDPHNQRFFSYLSMFTFFMLVLVTGDNYLILFIGWEGIGISSYLLINFWYTRMQANKAGMKALTVNRVGDMFLSVGFFAIFWVFGNVDYASVFTVAPYINETAITIIGLLLLIGAMAKSANIPLHTWLPDSFLNIISRFNVVSSRAFSTSNFFNKKPGKNRLPDTPLYEYLFSFLVGLIVAGCLMIRRHGNMHTARLTIKFTVTKGTDSSWLDYLYTLLSPYCYKGWSTTEEVDKRGDTPVSSIRATLTSATLGVFFPFLYSFLAIKSWCILSNTHN
ncbi:NADH-ubiquinone oxidoreductase chain 5 [Kwoniella shivajii]|uniref:NADH-ubiquinone oxidoreductase chain 5 n=1 Tax=Kwoniella shivajii TaxID=564305 RepID=A0ABZ1CPU5_9TREE|nr:NADH-ubiquinone oxidoreductase chain 5 [Kwoniella shivajii]